MARVTASTEIVGPPDSVWALLCDPTRYPELSAATVRMLDVPGEELRVGSVYREYGGVPPFRGESERRVTEFQPKTRQVHVGDDGSMTIDLTIDLVPTASGTGLTMSLDLRPRWFLAPINAVLWPLLMRRRSQDAIDATVANAKRIVESEDPPSRRSPSQPHAGR
ncbi:MAG: SRPBCC family protein [Chloroflexota bacterium]